MSGYSILESLDARIIYWDKSRLSLRACPLCMSSDSSVRFIRADALPISKCRNCGVYFISESPTSDELNRFYQGYNNTHYQKKASVKQHKREVTQKANITYNRIISVLKDVINLNGAKILDVGCGKGEFLYAISSFSSSAYGLDIDNTVLPYTDALGLKNVTIGDIEFLELHEKFNIITLNDVIEHPLNLSTFLDAVFENIQPGGFLSVVTPNGDSFDDGDATAAKVDFEHMQYFTGEAINFICRKYSCKCLYIERYGFPDFSSAKISTNFASRVRCALKNFIVRVHLYKILRFINRYFYNSGRVGSYHLLFVLQKT